MVNGVALNNRTLGGCTHWRHLANIVEHLSAMAMCGLSTRGGNTAYSQITVGNLVVVLIGTE